MWLLYVYLISIAISVYFSFTLDKVIKNYEIDVVFEYLGLNIFISTLPVFNIVLSIYVMVILATLGTKLYRSYNHFNRSTNVAVLDFNTFKTIFEVCPKRWDYIQHSRYDVHRFFYNTDFEVVLIKFLSPKDLLTAIKYYKTYTDEYDRVSTLSKYQNGLKDVIICSQNDIKKLQKQADEELEKGRDILKGMNNQSDE